MRLRTFNSAEMFRHAHFVCSLEFATTYWCGATHRAPPLVSKAEVFRTNVIRGLEKLIEPSSEFAIFFLNSARDAR
jgi:hypothetical protein